MQSTPRLLRAVGGGAALGIIYGGIGAQQVRQTATGDSNGDVTEHSLQYLPDLGFRV